jgi:hypothetical protein
MSKHHTDDFKRSSQALKFAADLKQKHLKSNSDMNALKNYYSDNKSAAFNDSNASFNFCFVDEDEEDKSNQSTSSEESFHPIVAFDFEVNNKMNVSTDNVSMFILLFPGVNSNNSSQCTIKENDA